MNCEHLGTLTFYALPKTRKDIKQLPGCPNCVSKGVCHRKWQQVDRSSYLPARGKPHLFIQDIIHFLKVLYGLVVPPGTYLVVIDIGGLIFKHSEPILTSSN